MDEENSSDWMFRIILLSKQKVIVTFIDDDSVYDDLPVGILSKYADPAKRDTEKGAFERATVEKHGNG